MSRMRAVIVAATLSAVALLTAAGTAPAASAATTPGAAGAALHQYVGYGYYGFPSPFTPLQFPAVNYPGSGVSAWFGYSAPFSSSGFPYGGYAYPYIAYANPFAVYGYGSAAGGPYAGSPGYPYTVWGSSYGNAAGPTAAGPTATTPSDPTTYWDSTGYYVLP